MIPNKASQSSLFSINSPKDYLPWIAMLLVIIAAMIAVNFEGHVWWCQAADYVPWSWDIWSAHNSQHLIDPYSFTHILHGILEFWLIGLIFPQIPLEWRMLIAGRRQLGNCRKLFVCHQPLSRRDDLA